MRKKRGMKNILKMIGLILLGVIVAPFVKPMLSKVPLLNKLLGMASGNTETDTNKVGG